MSQRVLLIAGAGVAVIAILLWLLLAPAPQTPVGDGPALDVPPTPTPAPEHRVMLLFVGADGMLHPELRSAPLPDEVHERIKTVMAELLAENDAGNLTEKQLGYARRIHRAASEMRALLDEKLASEGRRLTAEEAVLDPAEILGLAVELVADGVTLVAAHQAAERLLLAIQGEDHQLLVGALGRQTDRAGRAQ